MQKIGAFAGVAALAIATAACSSGDAPDKPAEPVATEEAVAAEATADAAVTDGDPMATSDGIAYASLTGDAAAGKRVFAQCRSCHEVQEGVNKTGPSLAGIIGRDAGSVDGYNYSEANATAGLTWTEEQMYVYLEDPRGAIPGTKMVFPGLRDAQDRADVIAYLKDPS